jgi:hypothetical protein
MRQVLYAMQFTGTGGPTDQESVLAAASSSPSSRIVSRVGSSGLKYAIEQADGDTARFESTVRMTGEKSFSESGTISFGAGNSLRFSTIGEGYLAGSPQEGLAHGSVMWRVDGGERQFDGATGIITSNFTFSNEGEVTDNQFGVIWVR